MLMNGITILILFLLICFDFGYVPNCYISFVFLIAVLVMKNHSFIVLVSAWMLVVSFAFSSEFVEVVPLGQSHDRVHRDAVRDQILREANEAKAIPLRQSQSRSSVLANEIETHNGTFSGLPVFGDQFFLRQFHFHGYDHDNSVAGSNISDAIVSSVANKRIRIAIIDAGFYRHSDISYSDEEAISVVPTIYPIFDEYGNRVDQRIEFNWVFNDDFPNDGQIHPTELSCGHDHGTAVISQLNAISDNGIGIAGITDKGGFDVIPVRVGNCGEREMMLAGMWAALGEYGPFEEGSFPVLDKPVDIISVSAASRNGCSSSYQSFMERAEELGVLVVAGAGNNGAHVMGILNANHQIGYEFAPASCPTAVSVGSVNEWGYVASFSNWGPEVTVSAFGRNVPAATYHGAEYSEVSGTSISTPIVSGIAALALQKYPDLTPANLRALLRSTALPFMTELVDTQCYWGEICPWEHQTCNGHVCSGGIVNAGNLMKALDALYAPSSLTARSSASMPYRSERLDLYGQFMDIAELCSKKEIILPAGYGEFDNFVELYSLPETEDALVSNAAFIGTLRGVKAILPDITEDSVHAIRVCNVQTGCNDEALSIVEIDLYQTLDICQ